MESFTISSASVYGWEVNFVLSYLDGDNNDVFVKIFMNECHSLVITIFPFVWISLQSSSGPLRTINAQKLPKANFEKKKKQITKFFKIFKSR